jgi:peptidoglycan/xylan/chitin deacetylase (PgdA/CDA1 family)
LRGHFFITVNYLNAPGFVTAEQVRELKARSHGIGTHSCSHPERMSSCSWQQLVQEWRQSREILSEILGEPVTMGSVPGGYYSRKVAQAAAHAGLLVLFTSEPTPRVENVDGCWVVGRYSIHRGVAPKTAAALAAGRLLARGQQVLSWKLKKLLKMAGGPLYPQVRRWILQRGSWSDRTN